MGVPAFVQNERLDVLAANRLGEVFIRSCLKNGHEAIVAAPGALEATATATGATWEFGDPPQEEMAEVMGSLGQLTLEEANRRVVGEIFGRLDPTAAVPRLREVIEEWRPGLVVRESAEFGAAVAAELHGVPHVRVAIGLGEMEVHARGRSVQCGRAAALARALRPQPPRRHAHLHAVPRRLEEDPLPTSRFRDPAWVRSKGGDPFVYVTFGSSRRGAPDGGPRVRRGDEGAGGLGCRGAGHHRRRRVPGPAGQAAAERPGRKVGGPERRADERHRGRLPRRRRYDAGNAGRGRALVVVPLFSSDQYINARRVAASGAGVNVAPQANAIRAGIDDVLADTSYGRAACALADELGGHRSTDDAFPRDTLGNLDRGEKESTEARPG